MDQAMSEDPAFHNQQGWREVGVRDRAGGRHMDQQCHPDGGTRKLSSPKGALTHLEPITQWSNLETHR